MFDINVEAAAELLVQVVLAASGLAVYRGTIQSLSLVSSGGNHESHIDMKTSPGMTRSTSIKLPFEHERKMADRIHQASSGDNDEHPIEKDRVVVRVPATSANLGPGFDTIGMALDMWSEFTVERADKFEVICEGEGSHDMPLDETNLVCSSLKAAFKAAGKPVPTLKYTLVNKIPYARGLGSSSAAIVGGLLAGLVLVTHTILSLCTVDLTINQFIIAPGWSSSACLGVRGDPQSSRRDRRSPR
jgi:GHMP kinases N terminal domain